MTDRRVRWLSTREAAQRLGVSEASIRRWGDRGALPVHRVGKRRERRFRLDHIERIASRHRSESAAARTLTPPAEHVLSHLLVGGQPIAPGTHIAAFYDSDPGRTRLTVPFLAEGLLAGEPCLLFAHGEELESYLEGLRRHAGVDLEGALAAGLLVIGEAPGRTVEEALAYWETALWQAMDNQAAVIRAVGEMASERNGFVSEDEMLRYEAMLNTTTKRFPCVVICQYDVRKFSGQAILQAFRAHPDILSVPLGMLLK